jgi:hypothetical protein
VLSNCPTVRVTETLVRKTDVLCPAPDLAQDQVYSTVSLNIGQGIFFRGQQNKELFFPKTIKFFPTPTDVSVVKEGWSSKRMTGTAIVQEVPKGFSVDTVQQQRGSKN